MDTLLQEIDMILSTFKRYYHLVNINTDYYIVPEEYDRDSLIEGHKWVSDIFTNEFSDLKYAWNLLTPQEWKAYALYGSDFDDHQEVILLRKAKAAFRAKIVSRKRPDFWKKTKNEPKRKTRVSKNSDTN